VSLNQAKVLEEQMKSNGINKKEACVARL